MRELFLLPTIGFMLATITFYWTTTMNAYESLLAGVIAGSGMFLVESSTSDSKID